MSGTDSTREEAERILAGNGRPWPTHAREQVTALEESRALAGRLQRENAYGLARKILERARSHLSPKHHVSLDSQTLERWQRTLAGEHAMCTYKDQDLPADQRFDEAAKILTEGADLETTTDPDTLGKAGAIYKRKWELDGRRRNLELACHYYLRGYGEARQLVTRTEIRAGYDYGFTGIAAAWNLDLLAEDEFGDGEGIPVTSTNASERRRRAREIRQELLDTLERLPEHPALPAGKKLETDWWFLATISEAYFGLRRYDEAKRWLLKAKNLRDREKVPDWQYTTTVRQLVRLASLHVDPERAIARAEGAIRHRDTAQAVRDTLDQTLKEVRTLDHGPDWQYERAARRLVRRTSDVLDPPALEETAGWDAVKILLGEDAENMKALFAGKVGLALSGGGFRASLFHIGVLAHLAELDMLRHIEVISCVSGGSIIGAHYYLEVRKLLQQHPDGEIEPADYVAIVKRIADEFLTGVQRNIRTRVFAGLTANLKMLLTDYTRTTRVGELYERELYSKVQAGDDQHLLRDLLVKPVGNDGRPMDFNPKYGNWRRKNKVPILIINATTLNTGHNWQYTASWMGESPFSIDPAIDGNYRLRRLYHQEAPPPHDSVRLGFAVGASSCVPGLFPPLALDKLYPGKTVRLVDGGVHDNQGIVGLLAEDCTVFLVSDASGQMGTQDNPSKWLMRVPLRSNTILMSRVREAEYHDLKGRRRAALLRGFMFVHLKKELDVEPIDWIPREAPAPRDSDANRSREKQHSKPTSYGIPKDIQQRLADVRTDLDSFCDAEAYALMTSGYRMTEKEFPESVSGFPDKDRPPREPWTFLRIEPAMKNGDRNLRKLLDAAGSGAFRVWKLGSLSTPLRLLRIVLAAALTLALLAVFAWGGWALSGSVDSPWGFVLRLVAAIAWAMLAVWLVVRWHLHVVDREYLRLGRVENFVR